MYLQKKTRFIKIFNALILTYFLLLMTACSSVFHILRNDLNELDKEETITEHFIQIPLEDEVSSFHTHKNVDDYTDQLAHALAKKIRTVNFDKPIVVASFVYFDETLNKTDKTGNLISESLLSQLQEYGIPVMDIHLMGGIEITKRGDFVFSRDVNEVIYTDSLSYILSGMLIKNERGIQVNARILEISTKKVISTATTFIPYFVIEAI